MRWLVFCLLFAASVVRADTEVLQAVNAERAAAGRAALAYDDRLEAVARAHGQDMARQGFFSHTGSDGSDIGQRLRRGGVSFCFAAENIAQGQRSLAQVMAGWMGSRGHRRNILHRQAETVAVARVPGDIWVMVLAAGC
ncbi:CAP domain-containing protein [Tateyamaria sp. SN6-1]|uniref:CAP domain-containing protein n=1 Tax=Tateyamaria sp. SN6-1 TaxID=3092148 RepID=UPI0039F5B337